MTSVSITIPCRNEKDYIGKCLDSIVACDYPKEGLSVFVCDGHSDDGTQDIVREYSERYPYIHLLMNDARTTPQALNLGLKAQQADYRFILGAHAEIDAAFVSESIKAFENDDAIGCTGGIIENVYENEVSLAIGKAMGSSFGVGNAHFRTGVKDGYVDTVAFGCYKGEVFDRVGYFDEELVRNQDDEFNYRLLKNGYKIWLTKKVRSLYYVRASFAKLKRQYYQYGYWKVYVNKKHRAITTMRQLVPLALVCYFLMAALATVATIAFMPEGWVRRAMLWLTWTPALLYILLGLKEVLKVAGGSNYLGVWRAFTILHFSYGWGYLEGVVHFLLLRKQPTKTKLSR